MWSKSLTPSPVMAEVGTIDTAESSSSSDKVVSSLFSQYLVGGGGGRAERMRGLRRQRGRWWRLVGGVVQLGVEAFRVELGADACHAVAELLLGGLVLLRE